MVKRFRKQLGILVMGDELTRIKNCKKFIRELTKSSELS